MSAKRNRLGRRHFLYATMLFVASSWPLNVALPSQAAPSLESPACPKGQETTTTTPKGFTEDWKRPNGPLGNGWRLSHDDHAHWWDPMEIYNGAPVNTDPDQGAIAQTDNSGSRAAAYQLIGIGKRLVPSLQ